MAFSLPLVTEGKEQEIRLITTRQRSHGGQRGVTTRSGRHTGSGLVLGDRSRSHIRQQHRRKGPSRREKVSG